MSINTEHLAQRIYELSSDIPDAHLRDRVRFFVNVWDNRRFYQENTVKELWSVYEEVCRMGCGQVIMLAMESLMEGL